MIKTPHATGPVNRWMRMLAFTLCALVLLAAPPTHAAPPDREKLITSLLASEGGVTLQQLLGTPRARDNIGLILDRNLYGAWTDLSPTEVLTITNRLLQIENTNIRTAQSRLTDLARELNAGTLRQITMGNILAPAEYGVEAGDSDTLKAAKWIHNASNSVRAKSPEIVHLARILEVARVQTVLSNTEHLKVLNHLLVNDEIPETRPIVPGSPIASSVAGQWLMQQAISELARKNLGDEGRAWEDVAGYLFGALIRSHGFVDGNGRTARTAYALALLQGGVPFHGMTIRGEALLDGLRTLDGAD